ncbi:MAG: hypothetical protein RLZZ522_925 [Verrucomicrobiota bacterium]
MRPLTCLLTLLALAANARAAGSLPTTTLVTYDAPVGNEFAVTTTLAGLSASPLLAGNSAATLEPGVAVPSSVFLMTAAASPTAAAAVANQQYFQFTVTPQPGMTVTFDALAFRAAKGGSAGPRGWALTTSLDGFAAIQATATIATTAPTFTDFQVLLPGGAPIDTATVFRLYGFAPVAGNGIFFDSISLSGTLVPEPSSAVLLTLAATAALVRRRRYWNR